VPSRRTRGLSRGSPCRRWAALFCLFMRASAAPGPAESVAAVPSSTQLETGRDFRFHLAVNRGLSRSHKRWPFGLRPRMIQPRRAPALNRCQERGRSSPAQEPSVWRIPGAGSGAARHLIGHPGCCLDRRVGGPFCSDVTAVSARVSAALLVGFRGGHQMVASDGSHGFCTGTQEESAGHCDAMLQVGVREHLVGVILGPPRACAGHSSARSRLPWAAAGTFLGGVTFLYSRPPQWRAADCRARCADRRR
jgi:hypothetical protein